MSVHINGPISYDELCDLHQRTCDENRELRAMLSGKERIAKLEADLSSALDAARMLREGLADMRIQAGPYSRAAEDADKALAATAWLDAKEGAT